MKPLWIALLILVAPVALAEEYVGDHNIADSSCVVMFSSQQDLSDVATVYYDLRDGTTSTTESTQNKFIAPVDMYLHTLLVEIGYAPGAGATRVFTVRTIAGDSAVTCTTGVADTACSNVTDSVLVSQGTPVNIKASLTGAPADDTYGLVTLCGAPD